MLLVLSQRLSTTPESLPSSQVTMAEQALKAKGTDIACFEILDVEFAYDETAVFSNLF